MNVSNLADFFVFTLLGVALPCCSPGAGMTAPDAAKADALPETTACTGDPAACLSGTLALKDFTVAPTAAKVTLYHLFPHGNVEVIATTSVTDDGKFAFSGVPAWAHYYLQGEMGFGTGTSATAIVSTVGSFAVPATQKPIAITIRPVLLEVLQQASSGGSTLLSWASAHLYDPASGQELTQGSVSFKINGMSFPMSYGKNVGGTKSFNVNLPPQTPGGTSFTITTSYPELGDTPVSWKLTGKPTTFDGAITSPTGAVSAKTPLKVTWEPQPMAAYSLTELFEQQDASYVQRYVSPTAIAPDVTRETVPASALPSSGTYLLNEDYADATCPTTSDGCVYDVLAAAANLTVQ